MNWGGLGCAIKGQVSRLGRRCCSLTIRDIVGCIGKALALPLNVLQSVELNAPRLVADAVGTCSVITGVVVPLATVELRSVPVVPKVRAATLVTVPEPLLLNVVQSVLDRYPSTLPVALGMLIAGVVPPLDTTGAVPDTLVTLLLKVVQSVEVNAPRFVPEAEGRLKVWVAVALLMLKSDPEVPVAKY